MRSTEAMAARPLGRCSALVLSLLLGGSAIVARAGDSPAVDFGRDVLPILSDNCFHCHGPDAGSRKADLRLDTEEGAKDGEFPVILPGQPEESELIFRVTSDDPAEVMPPPGSNRRLGPEQVAILRRWVAEGATWSRHWSLEPPARPPLPRPLAADWIRNPVDCFILDRLDCEGLGPSPEASRETLIRRVSLDLTGLPPTPAEVDAFLADDRPDAFEQLVDRLLASPRFGERLATDWLDLARFADTHGYQADRERPVWPYRDWVIDAFNRNLPFDQFGTWQLAGDLLPQPTREQRLATAFNRLHMQNEEGGIIEEEFRVAYVMDRVNTLGTAFLGLTLECARCHDHKYDPISQKEYYQLFAFFQNIDESGQTSYFTRATPVPALRLTRRRMTLPWPAFSGRSTRRRPRPARSARRSAPPSMTGSPTVPSLRRSPGESPPSTSRRSPRARSPTSSTRTIPGRPSKVRAWSTAPARPGGRPSSTARTASGSPGSATSPATIPSASRSASERPGVSIAPWWSTTARHPSTPGAAAMSS